MPSDLVADHDPRVKPPVARTSVYIYEGPAFWVNQ